MNISYEGIGQWAATFACADVAEGQVVKISEGDTVAGCSAGDEIAGVVLAVGRDESACTVALGGMVTTDYSGDTAPTVGWCAMSANATGGMAADTNGKAYLVVNVDTTAKTVTFKL